MNLAVALALAVLALLATVGHLIMQYTMTYLLKSRNHWMYTPRMWIPGWFIVNYFSDPMYRNYSFRECWSMTLSFFRGVMNTPKGGSNDAKLEQNPDAAFNGGA